MKIMFDGFEGMDETVNEEKVASNIKVMESVNPADISLAKFRATTTDETVNGGSVVNGHKLKDSVSSPADITLAKLGATTMAQLNELRVIDSSPSVRWPTTLFAAEADRFELWAVNVGLFESGCGSLDTRVTGADSLAHAIRLMLSDFNTSLTEGKLITPVIPSVIKKIGF